MKIINVFKKINMAYIFLLPNLLIYSIFIFIPMLFTIFYSFTNYNLFEYEFIGIDNYIYLLGDSFFITSIKNTLTYALGTIFISLAIGLLLAVLLNTKVKGKKVFRFMFYLPNVVSVIASSMAWLYIYNGNSGFLNIFLNSIGLPTHNWLLDVDYAMGSLIVVGIWATLGYNMIVFISGLQGIPQSLYEAAKIDGANFIKQFTHITFPLLYPTLFFLLIMGTISSFQVFGRVYTMTNGGPMNATTTIVHQIYLNGFESYKMGYASAEAVVLLFITLIMTMFIFRFNNKNSDID